MTEPAIIELNDSGILLATASGLRLREPGYAWLTADGIRTGEEARRHAFLEPQRVFHQFWHQLSLAPLAGANGHARHHADLAYRQLLQLHSAGGEPQEILFAVPGTFSREQLSILLGLVEATPFQAVGLVDSAVAAAALSGETGEWLHLDLQLHQATLTRLKLDDRVERLQVQAVAGAGLRTLLDNWAQHIAHLFVRQYRYDPLHTAAGEQQLYDRMDEWLQRLRTEPEIAIELESQRGTYSLNLDRGSLLTSNRAIVERLQQTLAHLSAGSRGLLVSDHLAQLPGLTDQLGAHSALPGDAVISGVRQSLDTLGPTPGGLILHTRINAAQSALAPTAFATAKPSTATHLLSGHRAAAIGDGLYVGFSAAGATPTRQPPQPPWLELRPGAHGLTLASEGLPALTIQAPAGEPEDALTAGTRLYVHLPDDGTHHELTLIEVT